MSAHERSGFELDPGDRWSPGIGSAHFSGVQATVRMLIDVLRSDRAAGHRTAGFVSGYQGSPLAGFDQELQRALGQAIGVEIVHCPAVNEELGATAVMGSQLIRTVGSSRLDGVLGVWYGKAPGLDRSVDALRHANFAGAAALGGALALVGDDPSAKSSTLPSASEGILADLAIPILFPRSLGQVLELGHHAVALSRWSGAWVALKLVTSVADAEGTISLTEWVKPAFPEGYTAEAVTGDLLTPATLAREGPVLVDRIDAAARYGDANELNRVLIAPRDAKIAIVAAGTVFSEVVEALRLLGLERPALEHLGVRLAEVRMPFPIGPAFARRVAAGVEEVIIIEERRGVIESQLLSMVTRQSPHPRILGRVDTDGSSFVPRHGSLGAQSIALLLAPRLQQRFGERVRRLREPRPLVPLSAAGSRVPWFCSGCPHSVSTAVPEGTLVSAGIGCHSIVKFMPEERVGHSIGLTQMGGEGAQWIGMAPFVSEQHIVANLGDGTYFHSGQLAVRAAVAAGVSMTYKILWNGVSAMTGGQQVAGSTDSPVALARQLQLEGVKEVVITAEDMSRYRRTKLPPGVTVAPREAMIQIQQRLAQTAGVTALISDQACATELRRARKRGLAPKPGFRVVINERVCEGCGDCQIKSNCLSLQTVATTFGPKTRIDEESCNVDLSCLQGDCPAFTLVKSDDRVRERATPINQHPVSLPPAAVAPLTGRPTTIRIAGIGGTGVVTVAHLLAWAAQIDGLDVWGLDQTGLSQKAGPVISDLRIGAGASERSNLLGAEQVDVLLAADLLAATQPSVLASVVPQQTAIVGSTASPLTGPMVLGQKDRHVPSSELQAVLSDLAPAGHATFVDATALARGVGLASAANVILLGVASQLGILPVSSDALIRAIEANAVSTTENLAAFQAGRAWTTGTLEVSAAPPSSGADPATERLLIDQDLPPGQDERIGELAADLADYQDARLASRFLGLVVEAWRAERQVGGDGSLSAAVASGYHKLLAYKDEYEVARLLLKYPSAEGKTTWLLHPPALRARGLKHKIRIGPWGRPVMVTLREARRLRGSTFDPFGRTALRRQELQLPIHYAATLRSLFPGLTTDTLDRVTAVASLPDQLRGYEAVKEGSLTAYRAEFSRRLLAVVEAGRFDGGDPFSS